MTLRDTRTGGLSRFRTGVSSELKNPVARWAIRLATGKLYSRNLMTETNSPIFAVVLYLPLYLLSILESCYVRLAKNHCVPILQHPFGQAR